MNKNNFIKGLDLIIDGLNTIKQSVSEEVSTVVDEVTETVREEVTEEKSNVVSLDEEKLRKMKYNEFKKYASSLGVDCKGTRDEIMARVLEVLNSPMNPPIEEEEVSEEVEEPTVEEEEVDEYLEQAKSLAEENSVEDIIDALKDVNIKATKKNYIEKLADALRAGLLELDDEEDAEEEDDTEVEEDDVEEVEDENSAEYEVGEYNAEYDPEGFNDPNAMTKKRLKKCESLVKGIINDITSDKLTRDDCIDFLENFLTEEEADLIEDEEDDDQIVSMYCEIKKRFIDDDGEENEPNSPYEIDGENFCCGHKLKYEKKSNKYICEICGEEYEADED